MLLLNVDKVCWLLLFIAEVEEFAQREAAACAALKEVINEPSFFDY